MTQEVVPPRSYPASSATRARQQYLDHGPDKNDPSLCRMCGAPWKCEPHLAAEAWLFPVRVGRGAVSMVHRPRPQPTPLSPAAVAAGGYPYVGTNPTQGVRADTRPDIPRKVQP